jgi:putative ABC transport system substrate-binding protein
MRCFVSLLLAAAVAGTDRATAQAPTPPAAGPRIGVFFWHDSPNDLITFAGVRTGLDQAGLACAFVERHADSDLDRAARLLAELREADCDVVLALGTRATQLADDAQLGAPIVFAAVTNPVAAGIVADWGPTGRPLCGASNWIDPANVLEVFRLAVPGLSRLGIVRSKANGVVSEAELASMREHLALPDAPAVELVESVAADEHDLTRAASELVTAGVDAIWVPIDISVYEHVLVVEKALGGRRIPIVTTAAAAIAGGALVGATVDYDLHGRRAAALLLAVLRRGVDPGSVPVDRMHGRRVVVNLRAAHRVGIELPLSLLVLADELIAPKEEQYGHR